MLHINGVCVNSLQRVHEWLGGVGRRAQSVVEVGAESNRSIACL